MIIESFRFVYKSFNLFFYEQGSLKRSDSKEQIICVKYENRIIQIRVWIVQSIYVNWINKFIWVWQICTVGIIQSVFVNWINWFFFKRLKKTNCFCAILKSDQTDLCMNHSIQFVIWIVLWCIGASLLNFWERGRTLENLKYSAQLMNHFQITFNLSFWSLTTTVSIQPVHII